MILSRKYFEKSLGRKLRNAIGEKIIYLEIKTININTFLMGNFYTKINKNNGFYYNY